LAEVAQTGPYPTAQTVPFDEPSPDPFTCLTLMAAIHSQAAQIAAQSSDTAAAGFHEIEQEQDLWRLIDTAAETLGLSTPKRQEFLETVEQEKALENLTELLAREIQRFDRPEAVAAEEALEQVVESLQQGFFLEEAQAAATETRAARRRAHAGDEGYVFDLAPQDTDEAERWLDRIHGARMTFEGRQVALHAVDRMTGAEFETAERMRIEQFLDWMTGLPWNVSTRDIEDRAHLDEAIALSVYGLDTVKKRAVEYLESGSAIAIDAKPILCLAGPTGTGKATLCQAIARGLGRKFQHLLARGLHLPPAGEMPGHGPGRIMQAVHQAGANNPVILLDGIDEACAAPEALDLLAVLADPEQRKAFLDPYLGAPFDLSNVLFLATARDTGAIPEPLCEAFEYVKAPGYTNAEKIEIAKRHLTPKLLGALGVAGNQVGFMPSALMQIIKGYTREAGVRQLARHIGRICRLSNVAPGRAPSVVTPEDVPVFLGSETVFSDVSERTATPGVAVGLAATVSGVDTIFVEALCMGGRGNLTLTGQPPERTGEMAQFALKSLRASAGALGCGGFDFDANDIHVHVPVGVFESDVEALGLPMLIAVASAVTRRRMRAGVAAFGGITLTGTVLPVNGIHERILAADRAELSEVVLPKACESAAATLPESLQNAVQFHYVRTIAEALEQALDAQ
ncbi:MAG: ATP-dependent Lon protease, partial [Candidatus Hydrogenedentes bacterium]|nr:ATP-dependent Lon protease [Candidatus Hydrogenedentota bacterium]